MDHLELGTDSRRWCCQDTGTGHYRPGYEPPETFAAAGLCRLCAGSGLEPGWCVSELVG